MITHESSLENFPEQFEYVLENYSNHGLKIDSFKNILLGGLGGSGIGAILAKNWFFDKCPLPIEAVADYHFPAYLSSDSLVILNSYSGNTEETLSLYAEAKAAKATVIVISAGGTLKEQATADGLAFYSLPTGYQPRMTIGFGLSYLTLMIGELMGQDLRPDIQSVKEGMEADLELLTDSGKSIFNFFKNAPTNKFVIVADRQMAPVATRFTQQLNENSKLEGFVNVLPECNHNVLESYNDKLATNFIMLHTDENLRVSARFDFIMAHLEMENNKVRPMIVPEFSLATVFRTIYRLDWVSVFLAQELDANLMEVPNIMNLKGFLSDLEIVQDSEE